MTSLSTCKDTCTYTAHAAWRILYASIPVLLFERVRKHTIIHITSVFIRNTCWRHGRPRGETKYSCQVSFLLSCWKSSQVLEWAWVVVIVEWQGILMLRPYPILCFSSFWQWRSPLICKTQFWIAHTKWNCTQAKTKIVCLHLQAAPATCVFKSLPGDAETEYSGPCVCGGHRWWQEWFQLIQDRVYERSYQDP